MASPRSLRSKGHAKVPGSFRPWHEGGADVVCGPGQYHYANWAGAGCTYVQEDRRRFGCGGSSHWGKPMPEGCNPETYGVAGRRRAFAELPGPEAVADGYYGRRVSPGIRRGSLADGRRGSLADGRRVSPVSRRGSLYDGYRFSPRSRRL